MKKKEMEKMLKELQKEIEWEKIKGNKAKVIMKRTIFDVEYILNYIDIYNKQEKNIVLYNKCGMGKFDVMQFDILEETDTEIHIACKELYNGCKDNKNDVEPYIILVDKCRGETFDIYKDTLTRLNKFYKEAEEHFKERKYKIGENKSGRKKNV